MVAKLSKKIKYEIKKRHKPRECRIKEGSKRCQNDYYARGVCNLHYRRFKDTKLEKKFMLKVSQ